MRRKGAKRFLHKDRAMALVAEQHLEYRYQRRISNSVTSKGTVPRRPGILSEVARFHVLCQKATLASVRVQEYIYAYGLAHNQSRESAYVYVVKCGIVTSVTFDRSP